jgi:prevent-host-death family protein
MESIISLSDFKAEASQWLRQLQEDMPSVVLTQNGHASAVVQSFDNFQRQQHSLTMLKLMVQGEADIQAGRITPQAKVFSSLHSSLKSSRD